VVGRLEKSKLVLFISCLKPVLLRIAAGLIIIVAPNTNWKK
jgi:hypothetical protein